MTDVPSSSDISTKWLGVTTKENWKICLEYGKWGGSDNRFKGLKQIRVGDKVVVYIKPMKIAGIFEVSREYFYDDSKLWKDGLFPHRIGFTPTEKILPEPIDIKRMYNKSLKPKKGSARGYFGMGIRKLPEIEYKLFESFIDENLTINPNVFVTGYSNANIQQSLRWKILGWRDNPHNLKAGDFVFIYDINNQNIDTGFRVLNKSTNYNPVWQEEIHGSGLHKLEFQFRWDVEAVCDKLDINIKNIDQFEPFKGNTSRKFIPLIKNNFPTSLADNKYTMFRNFLLERCGKSVSFNNSVNYFVLRTQPDSKWQDKEGDEYHFDTNVPRDLELVPGATVVFDRNSNGQIFFLGHAKIISVKAEDKKRITSKGRPIIDKIAYLGDYKKFDPLLPRDSSIREMMESVPGYNNQHAIRPITKEIYESILASESTVRIRTWLSLSPSEIDGIITAVLSDERRLEIDREIIRRIINHLVSGKHVILIGPPGTGKTDLALRILRGTGRILSPNPEPVVAVASYEWGRYEVIGGNKLSQDDNEDDLFHLGCVTKAVKDRRFLLVDEFNRADMNKAFGEMFLAIDHSSIELREDEEPDWLDPKERQFRKISLPHEFRMICTMNDYDKSLLNDLSYGLLRRFAFVEIGNPKETSKEKRVVIERILSDLNGNGFTITEAQISHLSPQIDAFMEFMHKVREKRNLGVSTSIDVIRYLLITGIIINQDKTNDDAWKVLDDAITDYILPQLDRLDLATLKHVRTEAEKWLQNKSDASSLLNDGFVSKLNKMISGLEEINRDFLSFENPK